jgi:aminomethyltransferase
MNSGGYTMTERKRTPLYPLYAKYGAKVIDFGGWELPVQFSSILLEHEAVRTKAGLFDVSHMGEVLVEGTEAMSFLQNLTTNDVSKLQIDQAQYSMMCYPDGGVVDDLLVYRLGEHKYMLVINAANIDKDVDWLQKHIEQNMSICDISQEMSLLALQGPLAETILQTLTDVSLAQLKPFHFLQDVSLQSADGLQVKALVSRTGYTGEDGFELYVENAEAPALWQMLAEAGKPQGLSLTGLGARDTLRFEARLPLYGQELSSTISPLEAGLGVFVKLDKGEFIGREALFAQKQFGPTRKLVGIEMIERGIPRTHYPVFAGDVCIGEVTTGTQSPTLKRNVGLALIEASHATLGAAIDVEIRGKLVKAIVVATPFYRRTSQNNGGRTS